MKNKKNIIYNVNQLYMQMKNPFEFLEVTTTEDEEQNELVMIVGEQKHKKTHHLPKLRRKLQLESKNISEFGEPVTLNQPIPLKIKCFHTYPYMERPKWLFKHKELTQGHYLDKQSGTGRESKPRKAGGGFGSVGNIKDQLNRDKYESEEQNEKTEQLQNPEGQTEIIEKKTQEPRKITLLEYYEARDIDLASYSFYKAPTRKTTIDIEWFKKQRLNLLQTKQDLKIRQRNDPHIFRKPEAKAGLNIDKTVYEKLGFGVQPNFEEMPRMEERDQTNKNRPNLSNEDFPTL